MRGSIAQAWEAWRRGDVATVRSMADAAPGSDEARHLRFLCDVVQGRYEDALRIFDGTGQDSARGRELDAPAIEAHLHLGRPDRALDLARRRGADPVDLMALELRSDHALEVHLDGVAEIPFAAHPLTEFFPAFEAELDGQAITVHVDTGGAFLHMGSEAAERLGIVTRPYRRGHHGEKRVPIRIGLAREFRLGDAVLRNVPVEVLPSLRGEQGFVIFGTSVLERFLATLDYPKARMILSPRGDPGAARDHADRLPERGVEVPFLQWADHYLFARGGLGRRHDLNLFVDSGLVMLGPGSRQACFTAAAETFRACGVEPGHVRRRPFERGPRFFESELPVSIGALEQRDQYYLVGRRPPWRSFGGVRIDGLISHAFLRRYAWTLDFDRRVFVFSTA